MATEYKIIYTYDKQANTHKDRSVPFDSFVASGDTDRNIGQITSITYEHWHTSTRAYEWKLRGRLKLADDTEFVSDEVSHVISGNVVKFTNTFNNLPTAEQFKTLTAVETLNALGSTSSDGYYATLYWHANSERPIRLIVTFIEEPPVYYDPVVKKFKVWRCDENGNLNDEAESVSVDLQIGIAKPEGLNSASLRIYYAEESIPDVNSSPYFDITSRISDFLSDGVENDNTIITGNEWKVGTTYHFVAVFIAGGEYDFGNRTLHRAKCSLHVAANCGGICVGGFSNGTEDNPMFESRVPARFYEPVYFYKGARGLNVYQSGEVKTGGTWVDGKPIYRYILTDTTSLDNASGVFGQMPSGFVDIISVNGMMKASDGSFRPVPYVYHNNLMWNLSAYVASDGAIYLQVGGNYSGTHTVTIIIEYTKDT